MEQMKTVDFSETFAASDLKVGRCRQLIELMKVFPGLYVFCFTMPRYQVSVYRTIGPLVLASYKEWFCGDNYSNILDV